MTAQQREVARLARIYSLARNRGDAVAIAVVGTRLWRAVYALAEAAAR